MASRAGNDNDAAGRIRFHVVHCGNHVLHELNADGIGAVGAIKRQAGDAVILFKQYGFVTQVDRLSYIANEYPPLTGIVCPVIQLEASELRNRIMLAASSG